jgi:erythrocyte band 7 integral membrane protein
MTQLMRQAADVLSSAPAMQIRYLETMQSMAKSANSKIIFMPGPTNSGDFGVPQLAGEGGAQGDALPGSSMQQALNARMFDQM